MEVDLSTPVRIEINTKTTLLVFLYEAEGDHTCLATKILCGDKQRNAVIPSPPGLWESKKLDILMTRPSKDLEMIAFRFSGKTVLSLSGWDVQ